MEKKVMRLLLLLVAVVFLAFYTVGYDLPYVKNPNLCDPLLTPVLLWMMVVMVVVALLLAVVTGVMSIRKNRTAGMINRINTHRITWCVVAGTAVVMIASFLMASTDQIRVNNQAYDDALWLRLGDMFIYTSLAEMLLAVVMIVVCSVRGKL